MKKKPNKATDSSKSDFSEAVPLSPELRERVAQKAYELYEKRGGIHGRDIADWLEAERLVMAGSKAKSDANAMTPLPKKIIPTKSGPVLGRT